MTGQHGTTIVGLLILFGVVAAGTLAFYFAPELQRVAAWWSRCADRRSIRRARRMSVRTVRGLGADLIRDEMRGSR